VSKEAGPKVLTKSKDTILVSPAAHAYLNVQVGVPVRGHGDTTAQSLVQFPCRKDAQERIDASKEPDAVLVHGRETKVGVSGGSIAPRREPDGPGFEENKMGSGIYAEARGICAPTNEDLIRREIWDGQENLEFEW
jgi:hypothetical protein